MAEDNIVQKIKRWKHMSKRPIGRPKTRWEDDVLEDIECINIRNWKKVAKNRDRWKKVVEQARTLYRLYPFRRRRSTVEVRVVHVTVKTTTILSLAQQFFYSEFMTPVPIKRTQIFM